MVSPIVFIVMGTAMLKNIAGSWQLLDITKMHKSNWPMLHHSPWNRETAKRVVDRRAAGPTHSSRNLFRTHCMFHNSTNKSHNTGSPFRFMQHHIIIYYRFSLSHWIYPLHPQRRFRSSLAISKKYINPLDTHTVHSLLHNTTFFIHFMSYHTNYF